MNKCKPLHSLITFYIFVLLLIFIIPNPSAAQSATKKLTVERIFDPDKPSLSGNLPSNINWMPDSKSFIYLIKQDNINKLCQYNCENGEVATFPVNKIMLQAFKKASQGDLILSPNGKNLLFSYNNDLYCFNLEIKKLLPLTNNEEEEENPEFSPDGNYIAYTKNKNLYVLEISTGLETQLTTDGGGEILNGYHSWIYYEELFGRNFKAFWWSPDSRHIVYYRFDETQVFKFPMVDHIPVKADLAPVTYPKAGEVNPLVKVGVISIEDKKTVWMDTSSEEEVYIARAIWLPDGKKLNIQLLNREQNKLQFLLADPLTGKTEHILTEKQKSWVENTDDIYFMPEKNEFIVASDKSGWRHLYHYDYDGNLISQLTKGNLQVSSLIHVDEDNGLIYFAANKKSSLQKHFYRIKLDSSGFEQLSKGDGWHNINMSPTGKYYIDTYSNAACPNRMDLYSSDGKKVYTIEENNPKELAQYPLGTPEFLTFPNDDGLHLPAMMIKPVNFDKNNKYPVVIYIYGGPASQVVADRWGGNRDLWHRFLANKGFIVFIMDNRCSTHFGKKGAEKLYRRLGHWEIEDQKSAVKYLRKLPYIDPMRIGIWGWSYGGYNTCLSLLKAPNYFQVGISVAPVTDYHNYDTIWTERYMDKPQDNPEGYKEGSALLIANKLKGKLLLIHGTLDENVHYQNSVQLANEFIKHNRQFEFMLYPRRAHGISTEKAHIHLYTLMTNYFINNLKKDNN